MGYSVEIHAGIDLMTLGQSLSWGLFFGECLAVEHHIAKFFILAIDAHHHSMHPPVFIVLKVTPNFLLICLIYTLRVAPSYIHIPGGTHYGILNTYHYNYPSRMAWKTRPDRIEENDSHPQANLHLGVSSGGTQRGLWPRWHRAGIEGEQ